MNCKDFEKLIALYVGKDLAEGQSGEVKKHLGTCARCRALAAGLANQHSQLRWLRQDSVTSSELASVREALLNQIDDRAALGLATRLERSLFMHLRWGYALSSASIILVASVFAIWISQQQRSVNEINDTELAGEVEIAPSAETLAVPNVETLEETPLDTTSFSMTEAVDDPSGSGIDAAPPRTIKEPRAVVVKLLTQDPNIVIYWLLDSETGGGA